MFPSFVFFLTAYTFRCEYPRSHPALSTARMELKTNMSFFAVILATIVLSAGTSTPLSVSQKAESGDDEDDHGIQWDRNAVDPVNSTATTRPALHQRQETSPGLSYVRHDDTVNIDTSTHDGSSKRSVATTSVVKHGDSPAWSSTAILLAGCSSARLIVYHHKTTHWGNFRVLLAVATKAGTTTQQC